MRLAPPPLHADHAKLEIEHDVEEGYDYSYRIHNVVRDIVTLEFDVTWRQGAVEGTVEAPTRVGIRYQKTAGSDYIDLLRGSIVLTAVGDEVTAVEMIEHLQAAAGAGQAEIEAYFRDLFADTLEFVH